MQSSIIEVIKKIFFLFWLFVYIPTNSQNCLDVFLKKYQGSLLIKESQVDSLLNNCTSSIKNKIEVSDYFSVYFYRKRKIALAIKYVQKEINYYNSINKKGIGYENALYNKATFHYYENEFDTAIKHYEEIIKLKKNTLEQNSLIGIAKCYREKGDFYKAEDYFTKAIHRLKENNSSISLFKAYIYSINNYKLINTKNSILSSIKLLNEVEKLVEHESRLQTLTKYFIFNLAKGNSFSSLLKLNYKNSPDYLREDYFKKSSFFFKKALKYAEKDKDSNRISLANINLGSIYITQKKDSALYYLNKSLKYSPKNNYNKAITYNNIGDYYTNKKKLNLALKYTQKAINVNFDINENVKNFKPSNLQLYLTNSKKLTILYLRNKSNILIKLYDKTKKKSYLKKAIETIKICDRLIDITTDNSYELKSKFLWRKEASQAYLLGAKASHLLKDHKNMFYFMEKNRAILLIEDITQNTNQENLPKRITNELYFLNKKRFELEDLISRKNISYPYSELQDSLFNLKKQHKTFNDSLKKKFPNAFNKKAKIEALNTLKKELNKNQIVISYISNNIDFEKEVILGLVITKNNTFSFEIKNSDNFKNDLLNYKKLISAPLKSKQDFTDFKEVSFNLYNQLIPSDSLKRQIKNKHLIVLPDVTFENIPFESLNTNKKNLKYLIFSNNISYQYSISFYKFNKKLKRKISNNISFFAPVSFNKKEAPLLKHTENEYKNTKKVMDGNFYKFDNATKYNFLNNSSNSKIIHLATHANASNNPVIYFSDSILPLRELYTYKNNADLVVLSACETNLGEIKEGEGTLSLSRGFFHSGANSVISSLWKINDASSSKIMKNFYVNLKNSQSKLEALNNAKRTYLKNNQLSETSPYYWASFVLIGDTSPTFTNNNYIFLTSTIVSALLIFFIFFKKRG